MSQLASALGWTLFAALAPVIQAADPLYVSARHKLESIEQRKVARGSAVFFSVAEINSWARNRLPELIPAGIREQRVELGTDTATGFALIDFLKLRHAQGQESGWLVTKLIEGERQVKVNIRMQSGGGKCTVFLTRVQIGVAVASGGLLNLLLNTFFLPLYPDSKINEAFELDYDIERIEIRSAGVRVLIKR
ncbi:MAG TPA: hypothetical protein VGP79_02150 [Bryobacteraceae bacterium]|jgi:hypothetical protein|nr:hypothetical protein [Bryobacteraceae bacterium]